MSELLQTEGGVICKTLWAGLENHSMRLHRIVLSYLKASPEVRDQLLIWFGECIEYNAGRKQVWGRMMRTMMPVVSDGFALNLCSVLLRLCEPFIKPSNNPKLLKIDPTYCAAVSIRNIPIPFRFTNSNRITACNVTGVGSYVPVEESSLA